MTSRHSALLSSGASLNQFFAILALAVISFLTSDEFFQLSRKGARTLAIVVLAIWLVGWVDPAGADDHEVSVPIDSDGSANTVAENTTSGTVGITASATDADATNNTITYSLSSNPGSLFSINSSSGVVSAVGPFDYESATSHTIQVRATSSEPTQTSNHPNIRFRY